MLQDGQRSLDPFILLLIDHRTAFSIVLPTNFGRDSMLQVPISVLHWWPASNMASPRWCSTNQYGHGPIPFLALESMGFGSQKRESSRWTSPAGSERSTVGRL